MGIKADADIAGQVEILIAEDSATQAARLTHDLSGRGYLVTAARNGREALAAALEKTPAIVITDIVMPEMDGYALCRAIKSEPSTKNVPVILLTSLSGPEDVLRGLECGADAFIRKPYDKLYLFSRIDYILLNLQLRRDERMQAGVRLCFGGQTYFITAERQQILDLLISTYEGAVQINRELAAKQMELARERDLLHILMDNVPDFIYFKDIDGRFTTINRALATAFGLNASDDAHGKTSRDYFVEEYAREALEDERRILETGEPLIGKIEHAQRPGGPSIWLSSTKMQIRDIAGSAVGTFGVSRDITQSKLVEEEIRRAKDELEARVEERTAQLALSNRKLEMELAERGRAQKVEQETQARFQFLFNNNPLSMWVYDIETLRCLEVNQAAVDHYGYSPEEFVEMEIGNIELEENAGAEGSKECKHRLKNGRVIDVERTCHRIDWRGRKAVLVIAQDVTEQKRLQREFILAQKMEAIATLAAGVAHDFNNLLTVVNGYCSLVIEQLNPQEPIYDHVSEIGKAGERAATLTRQLLAFSRKQMSQPRVLDLNGTVAEMDRMLRRVIGEDIDLVTILAPELGVVKADPGQMEQIVMNLAVNARDAMPKGGKLTIETGNVALDTSVTTRRPVSLPPGSYVMLAVSDTGIGMDPETQARIFEPFFTTKAPGKGTGLGLSTVHGIVEQAGGAILAHSEAGRGTTFKVYLPVADAYPAVSKEVAPKAFPRGAETILVVEDEDGVRALECRILQKQGYAVLRASNGPEAIEVCEAHAGGIDLLITDVVMPMMSGAELAQHLTAREPKLRVLFTSGYTDSAAVRQVVLADDAEFLAKPFDAQALARKVREVLDGRSSRS